MPPHPQPNPHPSPELQGRVTANGAPLQHTKLRVGFVQQDVSPSAGRWRCPRRRGSDGGGAWRAPAATACSLLMRSLTAR